MPDQKQGRTFAEMKYDGMDDVIGLPPEHATAGTAAPATRKTGRTSVHIAKVEYELDRAAYTHDRGSKPALADATFGDWVTQAVEQHVRLAPKRRAQQAAGATRAVDELLEQYADDPLRTKKVTRSIELGPDTADKIAAANLQDAQAGIASGPSSLLRDALRVALVKANDEAGGLTPIVGALRGGGPRKRG